MTTAEFSLGALVLTPLLIAAVAVLLPAPARRGAGLIAAAAVAALTWPVVTTVAAGEPVELAVGGYEAPLGITLRADGVSALFLLLTTVVGALVTVYAALVPASTGQRLVSEASSRSGAAPEVQWRSGHPAFWPLWLGCWSGLNAVFVSGDLFNTYVGLEVVGLTAVGLVALGGRPAWRAALRYLFVAVAGAMLFLVGVALLVAATGTLDVLQVAQIIQADPGTHSAAALALVLMTVGLAMKVALVPMHGWLIPAHSNAPGAVSPLLSALVIKASLFVLLRLWVWLAAPAVLIEPEPGAAESSVLETVTVALSWGLAALGVAAILVGSLLALRQNRLKPLIAYSTVAQAGYWFLFFPVLVDRGSDLLEEQAVTTLADDAVIASAATGTVALVLGHGLAKTAMFLVAGHFKHVYGTDELARLRGVGTRHPRLMMALGLAGVGVAGVPFSLAFSGKWELATAAVASGDMWIVAVMVLATLLSAGYVLRAVAPLLRTDAPSEDEEEPVPAQPQTRRERAAQLVPFTLGGLTVLTGFTGFWVADMMEVGAPW